MFGLKKKHIGIIALALSSVAIGSATYTYYAHQTSRPENGGITFKEFDKNTTIKYEVYADNTIIDRGLKTVSKGEKLTLAVPDELPKNTDNIQYKMELSSEQKQKGQDALSLLVELDQDTREINVKGDGLEDFGEIAVTKGNNVQSTISADWSGMFSEHAINSVQLPGTNAPMEPAPIIAMAFQNVAMGTDVRQFGNGKMEVFFGEGSRRGLNDVQQRFSQTLIRMTTELSSVMVQQTAMVGMFFDARIQLQTQRKHQELMARAHKDYHPSDQMCRFGTFVRSVAHTESKAKVNKLALNKILMNQYLGTEGSSAAQGVGLSDYSKNAEFIRNQCAFYANNGAIEGFELDRGGSVVSRCLSGLNEFFEAIDTDGDGTVSATELQNYQDTDGNSSVSATEMAAYNDELASAQAGASHDDADVNYSRTLAIPLTLDIDFSDQSLPDGSDPGSDPDNYVTKTEEDIIALAKHLYFPDEFGKLQKKTDYEFMGVSYGADGQVQIDPRGHYDSRSFAAKMGVAHSSFLHIVGMKSSAPEGTTTITTDASPTSTAAAGTTPNEPFWIDLNGDGNKDTGEYTTRPVGHMDPSTYNARTVASLDEDSGWAYMKALLAEFGISDSSDSDTTLNNEIDDILGVRPSYYAQMEVLTKKIYQHPNFYLNLYDKPANVERIGASITAISLMNQRDRFESLLRREMLTSVLLEEEISKHADTVNADIHEIMKTPQFTEE